MIRIGFSNLLLLAVCGVLNAAYAIMNFFMQRPDGSMAFRTFSHKSTVIEMGMLALATGACTIVAGVGRFKMSKAWLVVPNGLACSVLGLIFTCWTGRLSFGTVAILLTVMALSIGIY